ncbi:hypothetical protein THIX_60806 [Thiomonas sp. X19]|nr:hypothetical protein THIX_60806 [Thiomonas sp. X19]
MLRTFRTVPAPHGVRSTVPVASPADPLGVNRMDRKFFGHVRSPSQKRMKPSMVLGISIRP